jgi:hypothetical protein
MFGSDLTRAALLERLDSMGEARLSAALLAKVIRSGNVDDLVVSSDQRVSDGSQSNQQKAAELEVAGWSCSPPRDTLTPTEWEESVTGKEWVRYWGGTTALCSIVQPSRLRPTRSTQAHEDRRWSFRVRLHRSRVASDTGVETGEAATPEEARERADKQLQVLLTNDRRRRLARQG